MRTKADDTPLFVKWVLAVKLKRGTVTALMVLVRVRIAAVKKDLLVESVLC